jgi:hypothetical protein
MQILSCEKQRNSAVFTFAIDCIFVHFANMQKNAAGIIPVLPVM